MIKDGKKILEMMKYNRILCEEISLLFRTTDEQMKEKGWEAYNNVVTYDMSKKYFEPKKWFPNYLFRFYIKSEAKHILAYISILLDDDIENEYEEKMMEPLITAGFFDFGEDNEVTKDNWKPWYAKWYGYYRENGKDDGTIYEAGEKWQDDFEDTFHFQSYKCFGLPLTSITNASEVESEIINKLVSSFHK